MGEQKNGSKSMLFISKYPQIIQEFLDAMGEQEFEIDTALNGIEAAKKIKKKDYDVVVTGLSLEGYNGEQIITYLNKNVPSTVCIIYTTTISPAQLHFFINERNVFRVFLRPVDFKGVFLEALAEAFEYHAVQVKIAQDEQEKRETQENQRKEIQAIEHRMRMQQLAGDSLNRYMKRLMRLTLKEYAAEKVPQEELAAVLSEEERAVDWCCRKGDQTKEALAQAEGIMENIFARTGRRPRR
ncbi:MAG: response regulator [Roseburia sp.]|nr:response regulator [Roseburia sp.]